MPPEHTANTSRHLRAESVVRARVRNRPSHDASVAAWKLSARVRDRNDDRLAESLGRHLGAGLRHAGVENNPDCAPVCQAPRSGSSLRAASAQRAARRETRCAAVFVIVPKLRLRPSPSSPLFRTTAGPCRRRRGAPEQAASPKTARASRWQETAVIMTHGHAVSYLAADLDADHIRLDELTPAHRCPSLPASMRRGSQRSDEPASSKNVVVIEGVPKVPLRALRFPAPRTRPSEYGVEPRLESPHIVEAGPCDFDPTPESTTRTCLLALSWLYRAQAAGRSQAKCRDEGIRGVWRPACGYDEDAVMRCRATVECVSPRR